MPRPQRIGFVGPGAMGLPMAGNLVSAGREDATPRALATFPGAELEKWSAAMAQAGVKPE